MSLPWNVSLPLLRASLDSATKTETAPTKFVKSQRRLTVAINRLEAETPTFVCDVAFRTKADAPATTEMDDGNRTSVDGSGSSNERGVGEESVRGRQGEHEVRNEKERVARAKPWAWCDFCGKHAIGRRCCEGCKIRDVKTYYCDLECQKAAWHMLPKHRCGKKV